MEIWELLVIAVSVSADAFAVSICKGLSVLKLYKKNALITGVYFGGFQALMPLLGYWLGSRFEHLLTSIDHWIVFVLLGIIGFNMIRESLEESECVDCSFRPRAMFPLAVATSIDALAVGITFALMQVNIIPAISFIGMTTFVFSVLGVFIGNRFGGKYKSKSEFVGGVVLILMGVKILLEHLQII